MSRKKTKKQHVAKSRSTEITSFSDVERSTTMASAHLRLDDLRQAAQEAVTSQDWDRLLELGRHPLVDIHESDRTEAESWLLRARIWGLVKNGTLSFYHLKGEARDELRDALRALASRAEKFYSKPEFGLYVETLRHEWEDAGNVIQHLIEACHNEPTAEWLRELRGMVLWLVDLEHRDDEHTQTRNALFAKFPAPIGLLQDVYNVVQASGQLDAYGRQLLAVFKVEQELRNSDPWDVENVANKIRAFQSPSAQELIQARSEDSNAARHLHLTPEGWAFLAELANTPSHRLNLLLDRYPQAFGSVPCDSLRLIATSIVASDDEADSLLAQGTELLFDTDNVWSVWLGESLAIKTETGTEELYVGPRNLYLPADMGTQLLRFFEQLPEGHRHSAELCALYRVFHAQARGEPLEEDGTEGQYMPGLYWLCENSLAFQLVASNVLPHFHQRVTMLVEALARTVEENKPLHMDFYRWDDADGVVSSADAPELIEMLWRLGSFRDSLGERAAEVWQGMVGPIFRALSKLDDNLRARAVSIARVFENDLLAAEESFRLAFLEQVAGDKEAALRYYLITLDTAEEVDDAVINNMKLLWARTDTLATVARMVDALEEAAATNQHKDIVSSLLKDAKARQDALNEQDQFERTAVNRWPSISAPARKLLGVLANIQRYKGFKELAEYAGMQVEWVERHYNKLVDTGMLLLSSDGYSVNPHIQPLLELESQHSVVGRIVRSQGTSAVKQVFNSQREFTIYQVMVQLCPNHLVFPNCSLQSIMSFERMKELVDDDDFGYYLRASVDIVVVSSSTYLPMLAIEVDSVWHDTERQQKNDGKKDRLFAAAGIPFMRLRPVGTPSENVIRGQVAEHLDELVRTLRIDLPGYDQARGLLEDLSGIGSSVVQ